ncbi:MAG: long-chain fatty acid--CoA ligase [Nitrososphaerota archaeon]|nr:long-chain fatty acid--CoA ligase [Nitrososphaerota archaeon]
MQNELLRRPWQKFYPKHIRPSINYPVEPLQSLLTNSANEHPDSKALEFEGKKISYRELNELANQFANGLTSLGIGKNSKVAVILPNLPQFVICFYGALKAGAIVVPCNPIYREKELEYQLNDAEVEAVVILNNVYPPNDFFAEFEKARPRLGKIKHVFVTSIIDFLPPLKRQLAGPVRKIQTLKKPNTIDLVEFLSKQSKSEPSRVITNPVEDIAVLQYTGGTTGVSKGAMLTHYNLLSNTIMLEDWTSAGPGDRVLAVIPFFHIYGLTVAMNSAVNVGEEMVLQAQFHVKDVLEAISKHGIAVFPGVATMYIALLNYPDLSKYSIGTIRKCVSGAAPLPVEVRKKFNEITGGKLVEGYGLTEASPVTHCNPIADDAVVKDGSIGVPLPDTDAKIVDAETGLKDLAVGEEGELAIKGPQVMKGYWKRPDETEAVFRNGWLLTGDIAKMDSDGYFYIVDRKKDLIDASGFKVWPKEVEEVLYKHPDIKEAAVVGVKDSYRGETVKAFVVLKDRNKNPGVEAIQSYCRSEIAPYKVPKQIEFRDDLPKTLVGKVLRRKLREDSS